MEKNKKLNICIISEGFPFYENLQIGLTKILAPELQKKGHKVSILSWKNIQHENPNLQFVCLSKNHELKDKEKLFGKLAFEEFKKLHQKEPFDVLHIMDPLVSFIGAHKKEFQIKVVYPH